MSTRSLSSGDCIDKFSVLFAAFRIVRGRATGLLLLSNLSRFLYVDLFKVAHSMGAGLGGLSGLMKFCASSDFVVSGGVWEELSHFIDCCITTEASAKSVAG